MRKQTANRRRARTEKPSVAMPRAKPTSTDARIWLRQNGYDDAATMNDATTQSWESNGKNTRRHWRDTLSGGAEGRPYTVEGQEFPVLAAAQRRQKKTVTPNAIQRNARETPPPVRETGRWPNRR